MPLRCPSCNKFAATSPDIDVNSVEDYEKEVTIDAVIHLTCDDCGEVLADYDFNEDEDFPEEFLKHQEEEHPDDEIPYDVEQSNAEVNEVPGSPRSFIVDWGVDIHCSCGKDFHEDYSSEKITFSEFNPC